MILINNSLVLKKTLRIVKRASEVNSYPLYYRITISSLKLKIYELNVKILTVPN
jgi:hypothetical protein